MINTTEDVLKSLELVSKHRYKAMDLVDELFSDLQEKSKSQNFPDFVWSSLALELFHLSRYEDSITAYTKAIEEVKKLDAQDQSILSALYGDLSMVYEQIGNYDEAYAAMELSVQNREFFHGKENYFVRSAKENLIKLSKFREYVPNKELEDELSTMIKDFKEKEETKSKV